MKRKVFGSLVVFIAAIIMLVSSSVAYAAPNTGRGHDLNNNGYDGLRAVMSTMVGTGSPPAFSFSAKSPDVWQMFATQLHPKNSCLQVNGWHQRTAGVGQATTHTILVYDWCSQTYIYSAYLTNATIRSNYVRTISYNDTGFAFQDEVFDTRIVQTNVGTNQWTAYLFNYNTGLWDQIAQAAGTPVQAVGYVDIGDGGYTQDPTMSCPTLYPWGIMEIRGIQKRISGVWSYISASDITGTIADPWPCLTANVYQQKSSIPYQIKIGPQGFPY